MPRHKKPLRLFNEWNAFAAEIDAFLAKWPEHRQIDEMTVRAILPDIAVHPELTSPPNYCDDFLLAFAQHPDFVIAYLGFLRSLYAPKTKRGAVRLFLRRNPRVNDSYGKVIDANRATVKELRDAFQSKCQRKISLKEFKDIRRSLAEEDQARHKILVKRLKLPVRKGT